MSDRRALALTLGLSVLMVPAGAVWAMMGLAECHRADCGPLLQLLATTSGLGLVLGLCGIIGGLRVVRPARRQTLAPMKASAAALLVLAAAVVSCGNASAAEWRTLRSAPLQRTEVAAARVGDAIYVAGGFVSAGHTTAAVERYDIVKDRWSRVRGMPVALNHAAIAVYRNDVYVVGGYEDPNRATAGLLRYDPEANRWTRLPEMPTKRGALTAGVIGHRLYAAGGADGKALATLEVYDFRTRRWSPAPPLSVAREHLGGAVSQGAFHVLAGRAAGAGNMTIAERYLPAQRRWERLPDLKRSRGGTAATALADGRIVIAGGEEDAGTIKEVELYDPATRTWSRLPDMPTPRHGLGVVAQGRRVFTVQGGPEPGFHFSSAIEALTVPPH